jgi:ATPase family associated with various cellular activities (AAA)
VSAEDAAAWRTRNHCHLVACTQQIRRSLERALNRNREEPAAAEVQTPVEERAAIDSIRRTFALSPFERQILLLCVASELDAEVGRLCASLNGDPQARAPTFAIALAALADSHWSALSPDGPLRHHRLIDVLPGPTLTTSPLRVEERVLHYIVGIDASESRISGLVETLDNAGELAPSHFELARRITDAWCDPDGALLVQLCGPSAEDKRAIFVHACHALGLRPVRIAANGLPFSLAEIDGLARLWGRECALAGAALLVDAGDAERDPAGAAADFVQRLRTPVALAARERLRGIRRQALTLDVDRPLPREQAAAWRRGLGPLEESLDGAVDRLVAQFSLPSITIARTARRVAARPGGSPADTLWNLCRLEARPRMEDNAQRIVPRADWNDLVLPDFQMRLLCDVAAHVRARSRVHDAWGLADRSARGLSITALFTGPSGTGKTLAAEVLAKELDLDLYRIDLSQVVSKFIGESEKNLRRVFDAAEEGGAILLFDEADALFGKRSEVKDSHDRYANIEVSYLLQRMEAYRGLAILTSNLKDALDSAFLRRIRFSVHFPFPNSEERREIWRRVFPEAAPRDDLNYDKLARLNVAGGNIRNIAVYATFLAADAGSPVTMKHLLRAARVEFAKLERQLPENDIRGWV